MKTITTLHTAETQYFAQFEKFAGSLAELGPPANGSANRAAADLIPARLATTAEGSGYAFAIALTATGYTIHANPISFGATGKRTFFSDQSLTIHYHDGPEPATASGPAIK